MLDIALIRRDPERVRRSAERRGADASLVDRVLAMDSARREALTACEAAKAEKNALSARIARAEDKAAAAQELRPELERLSEQIAGWEERLTADEPQIADLLQNMANILDDSVPEGRDESANVAVRGWGKPPAFAFAPKPHWEIGEALGILDFERAAKLSGSRFNFLVGAGARLSRALIAFALDRAASAGYTEVVPPLLVSRHTMWSTGQLSKFSDAMFTDQEADLFLIPTAEVPLTALHAQEILSAGDLPKRYAAYSPCFRKEAGAAGKDTRGIIRQHQFEKIELVWLSAPETSSEALETLTGNAENCLRELELPYRVVSICAGDVGFNGAKQYDLEVWLPGQNAYREISSCSNCTDFQARRANLRFRREAKAKPEFVHTLNGTGLAIGRAMAALLENGQQADGSVAIPVALQPYFGADRIG